VNSLENVYVAFSHVWNDHHNLTRGWYVVGVEMSEEEAIRACRLDDKHQRSQPDCPVPSGVRLDSYVVVTWTWALGLKAAWYEGWESCIYSIGHGKLPDEQHLIELAMREMEAARVGRYHCVPEQE
jgi:hypothetical protein